METSIWTLSFSGTVGRLQYLGQNLAVLGLLLFTFILMGGLIGTELEIAVYAIATVASIVALIWSLAIATRRTRDTGISPWWVLLVLVPYVSMGYALYLLLVPARSSD